MGFKLNLKLRIITFLNICFFLVPNLSAETPGVTDHGREAVHGIVNGVLPNLVNSPETETYKKELLAKGFSEKEIEELQQTYGAFWTIAVASILGGFSYGYYKANKCYSIFRKEILTGGVKDTLKTVPAYYIGSAGVDFLTDGDSFWDPFPYIKTDVHKGMMTVGFLILGYMVLAPITEIPIAYKMLINGTNAYMYSRLSREIQNNFDESKINPYAILFDAAFVGLTSTSRVQLVNYMKEGPSKRIANSWFDQFLASLGRRSGSIATRNYVRNMPLIRKGPDFVIRNGNEIFGSLMYVGLMGAMLANSSESQDDKPASPRLPRSFVIQPGDTEKEASKLREEMSALIEKLKKENKIDELGVMLMPRKMISKEEYDAIQASTGAVN